MWCVRGGGARGGGGGVTPFPWPRRLSSATAVVWLSAEMTDRPLHSDCGSFS